MGRFNSSPPSAAYMRQWTGPALVQGTGILPIRHQAITWTNADFLSFGPLGTNFSEVLIEILTFSFKKMDLKMSSVKWRPFCPGRDERTFIGYTIQIKQHHYMRIICTSSSLCYTNDSIILDIVMCVFALYRCCCIKEHVIVNQWAITCGYVHVPSHQDICKFGESTLLW